MAVTPDRGVTSHRDDPITMGKMVMITNVVNILLTILKIIAVLMSASTAMMVALFDSVMDILSGFSSQILVGKFGNPSQKYYDVFGIDHVCAVNYLITASIFITGNVFLIFENVSSIINKTGLSEIKGRYTVNWYTCLAVSLITVVSKFILFLIMYSSKHADERMLAQDHIVDVIVNSSTVILIATYGKLSSIMDGVVGLQLCVFTGSIWIYLLYENIKPSLLIGKLVTQEGADRVIHLKRDHRVVVSRNNSPLVLLRHLYGSPTDSITTDPDGEQADGARNI
nr:31-kDa putative protein [Citrus associated ampelovirus 1]